MRNTKTPQGTETTWNISSIDLSPIGIEKYEDPAGDGNPSLMRSNNVFAIEKYEDPAGDGNFESPKAFDKLLFPLRNTKTPQGTETIIPALYIQKSPLIEKYEDTAGDGNVVLCT